MMSRPWSVVVGTWMGGKNRCGVFFYRYIRGALGEDWRFCIGGVERQDIYRRSVEVFKGYSMSGFVLLDLKEQRTDLMKLVVKGRSTCVARLLPLASQNYNILT